MSGRTVAWEGSRVEVEYVMEDGGLRQNFHVRERTPGTGPLEVRLAVSGPFCPSIQGSGDVIFSTADGNEVHAYRGLKVWDACGRTLTAWMTIDDGANGIRINVDDRDATYPITVDPVSTSFARQLTAPNGGQFGINVASAGDLNGDGYSDVAVGAWTTTNGGEVYVYYGSAAGIGTSPSVTLTSGRPVSNFGLGLDGAGDVNNDGYSDLVVGASAWNNDAATPNEGALFIYHGSATGINTIADATLQTNTTNTYLGSSAAGVGDINGDGYSDVVGGGWLAALPNSGEGAAWVYLGSATGLNPVFRHRLERNQGGAQFGFSVAPAGDINGDGFSDVIIGAPKFNLSTAPIGPPDDGAVFIYHGSANALGVGLNPNPTLTFNTVGFGNRTGWAVHTAGDVNGDGYSDIIIGDWQDEIGAEADEGVVVVYHGSAAGMNTTPVTILQGGVVEQWLGRSVSTAGDVNGDGYADVIIGAVQFSGGQTKEGAAFVHLGSPTGINSSAFLRYESNQINGYMGEAVSTAGDVNGDGYSDMIVGIYGLTGGGAAQIFHGGTYNVSATPAVTRASGIANARLGSAVANAGDVNGDGYSDAIFGAPDASNGQAGEGLAYVHYGSLAGLSALPSLTLEGNVAGAAFGTSVASAGDVNGDGYADVVVGAPLNGGFGRSYIFHGGPAGLSAVPALLLNGNPGSRFGAAVFKAGDHNSDGFSDVVIGAPGEDRAYVYPGSPAGLDPTPVTLIAPTPGGDFGAALCTAGDVNGDGFSDIVVAAPELSNGQAQEGAIYVYRGDLFAFPTTPQFAYESGVAGRRLGASVAGVGDVNGDGFYEVVAGAPNSSNPETDEGILYVFYGSAAGTTLAGLGAVNSNVANVRLGTSVAEAGDVNGDGYADVIAGAPGFSNGEANEGRAVIYLGGPTGIVAANNSTVEPNVVAEGFGAAVAGGGDVDGDGYSDVMVGSPAAAPALANEGVVRLFRGNNALAYNRLTRQYMTDLVSPLATNSADLSDAFFFGIGHRARSPIQRTTARLRWEVVHEGQPFSGAPITNSVASSANSVAYTNLGLAGVEIKELVAKAPGFYRHKWRARVEYPTHLMIDGQRFSRWFYGYASAVGDIGVLPVELIDLQGLAVNEGNDLQWTTGSEHRSAYFLVERSSDAVVFNAVTTVQAAGESMVPLTYRWLDGTAPEGLSYYRLRMVDTDGAEELSHAIAVLRDTRAIVIFPVPVDDALYWTATDNPVTRIIVRDALGRIVIDAPSHGDALTGAAVQGLPAGSYMVNLYNEAGHIEARSRFLKR